MKDLFSKKNLTMIVVAAGSLITAFCCLFQFYYYHTLKRVDISGYEPVSAEWTIEDISWKSPDYDYITGKISIDSQPVTVYPTLMVFYRDGEDTAYTIPVKMRNYYDPEDEQRFEDEKDVRGFMFISREYLTNTGEPSETSEFYCLVRRDNDLRRSYKIGFLMDIDGEKRLLKTDEMYAYYGID